eukprot:SAG22_NODE_169_length_16721_cov_6.494104_1_plen_184_part_00
MAPKRDVRNEGGITLVVAAVVLAAVLYCSWDWLGSAWSIQRMTLVLTDIALFGQAYMNDGGELAIAALAMVFAAVLYFAWNWLHEWVGSKVTYGLVLCDVLLFSVAAELNHRVPTGKQPTLLKWLVKKAGFGEDRAAAIAICLGIDKIKTVSDLEKLHQGESSRLGGAFAKAFWPPWYFEQGV